MSSDALIPRELSRRELLAGGASLLALAGCSQPKSHTEQVPQPGVYNTLKDFQFMNQNGEIISGASLRALVGNHPFTISFGFQGCSNYCPFTSQVFGDIAGALAQSGRTPLKHIAINTNPELAGLDADLRDGYFRSLLTSPNLNPDNIITLYPVNAQGALDNNTARDISIAVTNVTREGHANHSDVIRLYDAQGKALAEGTGLKREETIAAFTQALSGPSRNR